MKKTITLLFLLFICFKLSAIARYADTDKTVRPDTQKQAITESLGTKVRLPSPDTVSFFASISRADVDFSIPSRHQNNFSLAAIRHYPDSLNFSIPVNHKNDFSLQAITHYPDSLNFSSLAKYADSLTFADPRVADSLRIAASLMRQDSMKFMTYRALSDSVKKQLTQMSLDSLKQQLKLREKDLFKGHIYNEIASRYLDYDTISNKATRLNLQNKALNYTMLALHQYSYFNDTTGLRLSFDHLTKVYMAQKKYSQAKWFILQSNSLSRAKKDPPNIVASLITLSTIKSDLNDYTLAMRDLNEALQISIDNHFPKIESEVLRNFALLYSRLKNYPKEAIVLKKRDSIEESIRKDEEAKMLALINAKDSIEKKKADSVQNKKKVFTSNTRKLYKNNSSKKTASL